MLRVPPSVAGDQSELISNPSETMLMAPLPLPMATSAPQHSALAAVLSFRTSQYRSASDIEDCSRPPAQQACMPSSLPLPLAPPSETFQEDGSIVSFLDAPGEAGAFHKLTRRTSSRSSWPPTKKKKTLEKKDQFLGGCC